MMAMVGYIKKFTDTLVFISAVIGIIAFLFAIYTEYYKSKSEITLEQLASVNAFEINQASQKLKIFLNNQAIDPEKTNITWEKISIFNSGNTSITQNLYDKDGHWGVNVSDGEILDVSPVRSDETYITESAQPKVLGNQIVFPNFIFDKGKSISFELVIKHNIKEVPLFSFFGKISGVDFKYKDDRADGKRENFLSKSFSGSVATQMTRMFSYTIGLILLITIIVFSVIGVTNVYMFITRPIRGFFFNKIATRAELPIRALSMLEGLYVKKGKDTIQQLNQMLANNKPQSILANYIQNVFEPKSNQTHTVSAGGIFIYTTITELKEPIKVLYEERLIVLSNDTIQVDKNLAELLTELSK